MTDRTFAAFAIGFLGALGIAHAIWTDEREALQSEIRNLRTVADPLKFECPTGTVKLATKSDSGPWHQRCIGAGRAKVM